MAINWQEILTAFVTTIGGGAALLGAAAWLIKTVISNRLALDVEQFKIEIKTKADMEIERAKADLTRSIHIHERQLDIIQRLYRHLQDAQALFQSTTRAGRFGGEITPQEYMPLVVKAIEAAREELVQGRLLIPPALVQQCDSFFKAVLDGQLAFSMAHLHGVDPTMQARYWDEAATLAHQELPKILKQIDEAARVVIYGERS